MNLRRARSDDLPAVVALQQSAYAANRAILGVEPQPLQADYTDIFATMEVWLAEGTSGLDGALILQPRESDLLIWSVSTAPPMQGKGLGRDLLAFAEHRARSLGQSTMRLYTGTLLADRVAWYTRHGYRTERIEELPDRSVTHMVKHLA